MAPQAAPETQQADRIGAFGRVSGLLAGVIAFCLAAENLFQAFHDNSLGIVLPVALLLAGGVFLARPIWRTLGTAPFTALNLLLIAFGAALGTLVLQDAAAEYYQGRFGSTGAALTYHLRLHDVYHSWWFTGLNAMLALGLLKSSLSKPFSLTHLGFHLAHLGPVLVLAGFWTDYMFGFRGIIPLEVGETTTNAYIYQGNTTRITDSIELDFALRLNAFNTERHVPDYRIQLWRKDEEAAPQQVSATGHGHMPVSITAELIATMPLEVDEVHRIYGTETKFRMREFYPNFSFDYRYEPPEQQETLEPVDPGALLDLYTPYGEASLQLLSNRENRSTFAEPNHMGTLEFSWERPEVLDQVIAGKSDPEYLMEKRLLLVGSEATLYYIRDGKVEPVPMQTDSFYTFPASDEFGFTLRYFYPDASYLKAYAVTKGDSLLNPAARVQIWEGKGDNIREAYLYPGGRARGGTFDLKETPYFLALEALNQGRAKSWESTLAFLDEQGKVQHTGRTQVNEPVRYEGYRFYQSDYDPERPLYSGIGISHEPGLPAVYLGFLLTLVGSTQMLYGRRSARNQTPENLNS